LVVETRCRVVGHSAHATLGLRSSPTTHSDGEAPWHPDEKCAPDDDGTDRLPRSLLSARCIGASAARCGAASPASADASPAEGRRLRSGSRKPGRKAPRCRVARAAGGAHGLDRRHAASRTSRRVAQHAHTVACDASASVGIARVWRGEWWRDERCYRPVPPRLARAVRLTRSTPTRAHIRTPRVGSGTASSGGHSQAPRTRGQCGRVDPPGGRDRWFASGVSGAHNKGLPRTARTPRSRERPYGETICRNEHAPGRGVRGSFAGYPSPSAVRPGWPQR